LAQFMVSESKTIGVFRRLVDGYDARVQYDNEAKCTTAPCLTVSLRAHGQRVEFSSPSDRFLSFCAELARNELGLAFTRSDMKALGLQLETVVTIGPKVRTVPSCCGCDDSSYEVDDE
jgi:hypothetical protein